MVLLTLFSSGPLIFICIHTLIMMIVFFSEMIEVVGHEYMEELFGCCESVLAEDGILILQVPINIHLITYD